MDDALYEEVKAMMLRLDDALRGLHDLPDLPDLPADVERLLEESAELCQRI
jgi:hypothetical protein